MNVFPSSHVSVPFNCFYCVCVSLCEPYLICCKLNCTKSVADERCTFCAVVGSLSLCFDVKF